MTIATNENQLAQDERVQWLVANLDYHKFELPGGVVTDGNDRSATADVVFDFEVAGKSLLDIGCNHGFYCIEAKKRGAGTVVGLEAKRKYLEVAEKIREVYDFPDYQLVKGKFPKVRLNPAPFDVVLLMNVVHHLGNVDRARAAILAAARIARERLVLCIRGPMDEPGRANRWDFQEIYQTREGSNGKSKDDKKILLSETYIRRLLEPIMRRVEIVEAPDYPGRFMVIGHK